MTVTPCTFRHRTMQPTPLLKLFLLLASILRAFRFSLLDVVVISLIVFLVALSS